MTPAEIERAAKKMLQDCGVDTVLADAKTKFVNGNYGEVTHTWWFVNRINVLNPSYCKILFHAALLAAAQVERERCADIVGAYATCDWDANACLCEIYNNPQEGE